MNNLNSLIIEGRIATVGELKEPLNGFKIFTYSIAVNRWYETSNGEKKEETSFFDCESYGKFAEIANEKAKKGIEVRIVGRLKQNQWKDQDGKSHSRVFVVVEHQEFKLKKTELKTEETKEENL